MATKNKTKKVNKSKGKNHKVQEKRILGLIEDGSFDELRNNTLAFQSDSEELKNILKSVFDSIKRSNPDTKTFAPAIILLFSSITEVFYLHKDRQTRQRQKYHMYEERIQTNDKKIDSMTHSRELWQKNYDILKGELHKKDGGINTRVSKKMNETRIYINELNQQIWDLEQEIKGFERSKELVMFDVSKNEKLSFDMTAQVMSKNERLLELLKQFNINPKIVSSDALTGKGPEGISSMFSGLGGK